MDMHILLPLLMKLGMALLLAFLSMFGAQAQDLPTGSRKIQLKMIREVDGKTVLLDTTLVAENEAALAEALKGISADSSLFRALKNTRIRIAGPASPVDIKRLERNIVISAKGMEADTIQLKAIFERLNTLKQDTVFFRKGRTLDLQRLDSLGQKQIVVVRRGDSLALNKAMPHLRIDATGDSLLLHRLRDFESQQLHPSRVEHIVVHRNKSGAPADTFLISTNTERFKVINDGVIRQIKVIQTGEAAAQAGHPESDSHSLTIMVLETSIKEITNEDKIALKAAGAPVETSPKEELKLEEVTYYPNPNKGRFHLSFTPAQKGNTHIRVLDVAGRTIYEEQVKKLEGKYSREIDISKHGRGIYFVQVAQGKRYFTRKLVVE